MIKINPVIQPLQTTAPAFNVATHDGKFHADEITALAVLTYLRWTMAVYRTRDVEILKHMDLCIDVGGGPFDHHAKDSQRYRENGMPLASAGLVWQAYGEQYVRQLLKERFTTLDDAAVQNAVLAVDRTIIEPIDAQDCGVVHPGRHCLNWIASFNTSGAYDRLDMGFSEAVHIACTVLKKEIQAIIARIAARDTVAKQLEALDTLQGVFPRESGILTLKVFVPWIESLQQLDPDETIKLVVFQDMSGAWRVQAVPKAGAERFVNRITLPEAWRGKDVAELVEITGVSDVHFCHVAGFIAGAATQEGALALAQQALQAA